MSENVNFNFSFAPHKEFTPHVGDSCDFVPFDGYVQVKLGNFTPYWTKPNGAQPSKPSLKVAGAIEDEDGKGLRLIDDVLCGGKDKNGDDLGRQFCTLLNSSGTPADAIRQNAVNGVEVPIMQIAGQLVGRIAYAEIQADVYEGKDTTKVINWITKEKYEQAKLIGAHRRKRKEVTVKANPQGANAQNYGGVAVGSSTANGATAAPAAAASGGSALPML